MSRDITMTKFVDSLSRHGISIEGFMGYAKMPDGTCVSYLNSPNQTWRGRLAYLLKQAEKHQCEVSQ